jgi:hypothetical protein
MGVKFAMRVPACAAQRSAAQRSAWLAQHARRAQQAQRSARGSARAQRPRSARQGKSWHAAHQRVNPQL